MNLGGLKEKLEVNKIEDAILTNQMNSAAVQINLTSIVKWIKVISWISLPLIVSDFQLAIVLKVFDYSSIPNR